MDVDKDHEQLLDDAWQSYLDCKLYNFSNAEMNRQALEKAWGVLQKIVDW